MNTVDENDPLGERSYHVKVVWNPEADPEPVYYHFDTKKAADAFMSGIEAADGWLEADSVELIDPAKPPSIRTLANELAVLNERLAQRLAAEKDTGVETVLELVAGLLDRAESELVNMKLDGVE